MVKRPALGEYEGTHSCSCSCSCVSSLSNLISYLFYMIYFTCSGPPPFQGGGSSGRSESKDNESKGGERVDDIGDKGSAGPSDQSDNMDFHAERGKSRGGTRGGKPQNNGSGAAAAGLAGFDDMPPNLDSEIQQCDGTEDATRALLGPLITKPKLSDKLLGKPPFRFLFDIVMAVTEATGFARGLFSGDELDSSLINEKEKKMAFLDKILSLVGQHLNTFVEAKSMKIVAGVEPAQTNNFLQLLAVAAKNTPNSDRTVKVILEQLGESAPAMPSRPQAQAKDDDSSSPNKGLASKPIAPPPNGPPPGAKGGSFSQVENNEMGGAPAEGKDDGDGGAGVNRSMRPTTARRRPPKVKDGAKEVTAKDTAPVANKPTGILMDGQDDDDDEDDVPTESRLTDVAVAESKSGDDANAPGPQSKIVKDIMSRQAEQEAAAKGVESQEKDAPEDTTSVAKSDAGGGIRIGRLRKTGTERGKTSSGSDAKGVSSSTQQGGSGSTLGASDIERLRGAIQTLVQHTGPLGTCMDFIHEDVGLMASELNRWEEECRKYEIELQEERRKSENVLKPMQLELSDLEESVKDKISQVSAMKASIARNEERIQQQLKFVATA